MTETTRQGLLKRYGITSEEFTSIEQLAEVCNQHEQITLKLNYDDLQIRPPAENNDFLYYDNGALVGYLGIYQFNNREIEISGMVHPAHRRQGIFSALLAAAKEEIRKRAVPKIIYMNQQGSESGKAFLQALGARYEFAEYWMKMTETKTLQLRHPIRLRPTEADDLPAVAHMFAVCFHRDEAETLASLQRRYTGKQDNRRKIIELDGTPIGTIAKTYSEPNNAFLYGFCVLPDYQGRGYGRQSLALTIQECLADGYSMIELEVACENSNALTLYQSCGFEVMNANDYYVELIEL